MTAPSTLLERVPWATVNERVHREQRNREVYVPPISLFRWWARRPHALIGALIDAAGDSGRPPVISDPFSGGGTVAMEAARRGLSLYAQDLHPWVITGLATILDDVSTADLQAAAETLLTNVTESCGAVYATDCPAHGPSTITHAFWVRSKSCPECSKVTYLFPYSLVTLASRRKDEALGFFGCPACGAVGRHRIATISPRCNCCGRTIPAANTSLLRDRQVKCRDVACGAVFPAFDGTTPEWGLALTRRLCASSGGDVAHFEVPTPAERETSIDVEIPAALREAIPSGVETALLLRAGFRAWADVFPPRQLSVLVESMNAISQLPVSEDVRARLRLAVCGAAEMAGYLSRWDRYYPKAFEAMANHRFPALGLACETNLLATQGRGTLRRRLDHSIAAARWAGENLAVAGSLRVADATARRRSVGAGALIVRGSSERQLPSDKSVDLVLTDPPYFDDVQYAELASLFLVLARAADLIPDSITVDVGSEAVANASRGAGVDAYRELLTRIFTESRRTLRRGGRIVLTYHNTDIRAWWALARALHDAKLEICALGVAEAENSADHPKRGSNAFTSDLVIECRRADRREEPISVGSTTSGEAQELYAAGRTLASARSADIETFIALYRRERGAVSNPRIRIPKAETA